MQLIHKLCRNDDDPAAVERTLVQLRQITEGDAKLPAADPALEPQIVRTRYALERWVDVWEAAAALDRVGPPQQTVPVASGEIEAIIDRFESREGREPVGAAWRKYLQLDALRAALRPDCDEVERRAIARRVLDRLTSPGLSESQAKFIAKNHLGDLQLPLRAWAVEPITAQQLLVHLEQYEYSTLASDGELLADDYRSLIWSKVDEADGLGQHLDTHYRNANVRVAIAGELVNRMLPQPGRINAPVRDTVVNVPVRGQSSTFTKLSVVLVPDARRIRLGLEAQGTVDARTVSSSGPATFRNSGQSTFLVRKLLVLGPKGLNVWPAIAEAENNYNYLVSLETDFDRVPLVGNLVRSIALNQHDEAQAEAHRQTERKVAIRALHQLDSEVEDRLVEAGKKLESNQGATLRRMGLELTPISLSTTERRVVARARLASEHQLGAHTPRPRAPSDAWFSMQLHQSALNNGLQQLDLEGRRFELPELFAWIADKLGRPELAQQEDLPEDVQVTFADCDAVRLQCRDGRIEVSFALAELTHEGSRWRNFEVHTHYAPQIDGLSPRFVRDDTIRLAGESLRGKLEFKLRAIFSRVLSKNRELRLLDDSLTNDPKLKDLRITQFEVEDGWIGLAYSPRRVSSNVARRPE